jgi:hypothetical protein
MRSIARERSGRLTLTLCKTLICLGLRTFTLLPLLLVFLL